MKRNCAIAAPSPPTIAMSEPVLTLSDATRLAQQGGVAALFETVDAYR